MVRCEFSRVNLQCQYWIRSKMQAISLDSSPHPRASRRHPESRGIHQGRLMRPRPSKGNHSHLSTSFDYLLASTYLHGVMFVSWGCATSHPSLFGSGWPFAPKNLTIPRIFQLQLHQTSRQHGHHPLVFGCSRHVLHLMTPVLPISVVLHLCGQ